MKARSIHSGQCSQSTSKPLFFVAILAGSFCMPAIGWSADINEFIDFSLLDGESVLLPGRLYVPPGAESSLASRPLVMFLHGASVVGNDNVSQIAHPAIDPVLAYAQQRGAYLYAPQTPTDWGDATVTTRSVTMLDRALVEYHVDVERLYPAGASLGGAGVWNFLSRYPDYFAAAISIASAPTANDFSATNLVEEPIWTYHNRHDPLTSVTNTRNVVSGILTAVGEPLPTYPSLADTETWFEYHDDELDLHYAESPANVHGGPDAALLGEMFDWMFAHGVFAGDYNGDGLVNIADYTVWRNRLGALAGTLPNDVDGGTIGIAQYNTWKSNFGATALPLATSAIKSSVPEPATLLLSCVAITVVSAFSRRR